MIGFSNVIENALVKKITYGRYLIKLYFEGIEKRLVFLTTIRILELSEVSCSKVTFLASATL